MQLLGRHPTSAPQIWRQQYQPKCWYLYPEPHSVTSRETITFKKVNVWLCKLAVTQNNKSVVLWYRQWQEWGDYTSDCMVFHPTSICNQLIQRVFFGFKIFNITAQIVSWHTSCTTRNLTTPVKSRAVLTSNKFSSHNLSLTFNIMKQCAQLSIQLNVLVLYLVLKTHTPTKVITYLEFAT